MHSPSLTPTDHCGNLMPTYENHVLVPEIAETE